MAKFIVVALTVMLVMQGYVSWHVWRVLPLPTPLKIAARLGLHGFAVHERQVAVGHGNSDV